MRWRNTLRIAHISLSLYPNLAGAKFTKWFMIMSKWRRNDLALWKKHCVKKPTLNEIYFAAHIASELTQEDQLQYDRQLRVIRDQQMNEYAYRALPWPR